MTRLKKTPELIEIIEWLQLHQCNLIFNNMHVYIDNLDSITLYSNKLNIDIDLRNTEYTDDYAYHCGYKNMKYYASSSDVVRILTSLYNEMKYVVRLY